MDGNVLKKKERKFHFVVDFEGSSWGKINITSHGDFYVFCKHQCKPEYSVFCGFQESGATFIVLYKCILYMYVFTKNYKHIM